jgi:hypothetical protein
VNVLVHTVRRETEWYEERSTPLHPPPAQRGKELDEVKARARVKARERERQRKMVR